MGDEPRRDRGVGSGSAGGEISSLRAWASATAALSGDGLLLAETDLFVRDRTDTASTASSKESFLAT